MEDKPIKARDYEAMYSGEKPTCRDCVCFAQYPGTELGACLKRVGLLSPVVSDEDRCKDINTVDDINRRHAERNPKP